MGDDAGQRRLRRREGRDLPAARVPGGRRRRTSRGPSTCSSRRPRPGPTTRSCGTTSAPSTWRPRTTRRRRRCSRRPSQLQPGFAKAHLNLGNAYRGLKEYEKAQERVPEGPTALPQLCRRGVQPRHPLPRRRQDAEHGIFAKQNTAIRYFQRYKQMMGGTLPPSDPAEAYIAEAQDKIKKEQKRIERHEEAAGAGNRARRQEGRRRRQEGGRRRRSARCRRRAPCPRRRRARRAASPAACGAPGAPGAAIRSARPPVRQTMTTRATDIFIRSRWRWRSRWRLLLSLRRARALRPRCPAARRRPHAARLRPRQRPRRPRQPTRRPRSRSKRVPAERRSTGSPRRSESRVKSRSPKHFSSTRSRASTTTGRS